MRQTHEPRLGYDSKCGRTYTERLGALRHWADDPAISSILRLHGQSGTGKTALVDSLADNLPGLAHVFRCTNESGQANQMIKSIIPTLAIAMASSDTMLGEALATFLRQVPHDWAVEKLSYQEQFDMLICEPKRFLRVAGKPHVFVIDGLEQCLQSSSANLDEVRDILRAMVGRPLLNLFSLVKVIVVSQPDPVIERHFRKLHSSHSGKIVMEELPHINDDVRNYLFRTLGKITSSSRILPHEWPPRSQVETLVQRANGFVIYSNC